MARHRRREREQLWREVIRDQTASGLSISAFCRDRNVSPASFFNWRRKLADRDQDGAAGADVRTDGKATGQHAVDAGDSHADAASKFVAVDFPLPVAAEASMVLPDASETEAARALRTARPAAAQLVSRSHCEVVLPDGCRVIVPAGCDAGWLRDVLAVVRDSSSDDASGTESSC